MSGELDLSDIQLPYPLAFIHCYFDEPIALGEANVRSVRIEHSWLPGVEADGLIASGSLSVKGSRVTAGLSLRGAQVGGALDLEGARLGSFGDKHNVAFRGNRLRTQGPVYAAGAVLAGKLALRDASLTGGLSLKAAKLRAVDDLAFDGLRLRTETIVDLSGSEVRGTILLGNAQIRGDLLFGGANCHGGLNLESAVIGGGLLCSGATLRPSEGAALAGQGLSASDAFLDSVQASGEVNLHDADLRGDVNFSGSLIENPQGLAINGQDLRVRGNLFLQALPEPSQQDAVPPKSAPTFIARGGVNLLAARIDGSFIAHEALIEGTSRDTFALCFVRCEIGTDLQLIGTSVAGANAVGLYGATVKGDVDMSGARLKAPHGWALSATSARVGGALSLRFSERPHGRVELTHARVGRLVDTAQSWPEDERSAEGPLIDLTGFEYSALESDLDATARCNWLRRAKYSPQPFEYLSRLYLNLGQESLARAVAMGKRDVEASREGRGVQARAAMLRWSVGYGYKPQRALGWLLLVFILAWGVSLVAADNQAMVATKVALASADGSIRIPSPSSCDASYPCFNPAIYAAEDVLPIVNLHQAEFWGPDGSIWPWLPFAVSGFTLLGWLITSLLVAALAGFMRKR